MVIFIGIRAVLRDTNMSADDRYAKIKQFDHDDERQILARGWLCF
jgi:hypothetical protein